jgi:hypothetical protein
MYGGFSVTAISYSSQACRRYLNTQLSEKLAAAFQVPCKLPGRLNLIQNSKRPEGTRHLQLHYAGTATNSSSRRT